MWVKMWENKNPCALLVGMSNGIYSLFGKQFSGFLKKLNINLSCDPAIPFLGVYLPKMKTDCPHKELNTNVHGNIIHNSQKLELSIKW